MQRAGANTTPASFTVTLTVRSTVRWPGAKGFLIVLHDRFQSPRHSLFVLSASVPDTLRFAGGLICDRARQGWHVTVYAPAGEEVRPLRIVGAQVVTDIASFDWPEPSSTAIAVSADLYHDDAPLGGWLESILPAAELLIWGILPVRRRRDTRIVSHRLSDAARVFKSYAFDTAGVSDLIGPAEKFRTPRDEAIVVSRGN